jgi:hypothetical protein
MSLSKLSMPTASALGFSQSPEKASNARERSHFGTFDPNHCILWWGAKVKSPIPIVANGPQQGPCGTIARSRAEARHDIFYYIEVFYNRKHRHSALGYVSQDQLEQSRKMCAN